jgi:hypothetical protein
LNCYFTPLRDKLRSVRTGVRGALTNCNSAASNCSGAIQVEMAFEDWNPIETRYRHGLDAGYYTIGSLKIGLNDVCS